jgi:hypothetical protein
MRRRARDFDIFNISFLDVISCGLGAVVLIVLISAYAEAPSPAAQPDVAPLLDEVLATDRRVGTLAAALDAANEALTSRQLLRERLEADAAGKDAALARTGEAANTLDADMQGLALVQQALDRQRRSSISRNTATERDAEVGGIPVDSDYVVFVIDTSGSMKRIWDRVTREVENVIRIHPSIRGFQVLNDNGVHILSGYAGRWIPDTPRMRENVIDLLETWNSASNSSPVEGLEIALKRYVNPNNRVSIYIFGDEYSGSSYDPVIEALVRQNTNRATGGRLARVHAIGFLSPFSTGRFATLMREVTRRNDGTFLALPN